MMLELHIWHVATVVNSTVRLGWLAACTCSCCVKFLLKRPSSALQVIEMTSVSAAADIWSVGCLCLELLTGVPPYFELQPMSALFRIVADARPPLPDSLSPELRDFLLQCFHKV